MSKSLKIIFTLSIILNVLLLGVIAGHTYKKWNDDPIEQAMDEMSPEGRNIVARKIQAAFREGRDEMRSMRQSKKQLQSLLTAEEFDASAFEEEALKLHELIKEKGFKRIEITKELAQELSLEDRKVLAKRFSKGFHGGKRSHGGKKPHEFLEKLEKYENDNPADDRSDLLKDGPELPEGMPPQP